MRRPLLPSATSTSSAPVACSGDASGSQVAAQVPSALDAIAAIVHPSTTRATDTSSVPSMVPTRPSGVSARGSVTTAAVPASPVSATAPITKPCVSISVASGTDTRASRSTLPLGTATSVPGAGAGQGPTAWTGGAVMTRARSPLSAATTTPITTASVATTPVATSTGRRLMGRLRARAHRWRRSAHSVASCACPPGSRRHRNPTRGTRASAARRSR